ncbi:MAG TPA: APC family permease [Allosphingosinicella sp.]|nr:APC family permease [Allosphingosinicella sp.]
MSATRDEPLRRDIGFLGSAFLSFNGMVGAGIFALPGTLYGRFGDFSPFLFPLFGLLVLVVALPFARVAARHPLSGGPVVYAAAFGPAIAFQAGWIYYVARATALAANLTVLVTYLAVLWPALSGGLPRAAIILAVCGLLIWVNIVGVKRAVQLIDALTLLKAAPLVFVAILGLVMAGGAIEAPSGAPPFSDLEAAALLILYAFIGFENSVTPAGETANPTRNIPRALLATIGGTALLYFLVQLSYVAVMEPGAGGDAPMVEFGKTLMGPAGGLLLVAAAVFSLLGNIGGGLTGTSRTSYAMGRDALLPGWFGRVSARYATPANSIAFMGALIAVLALSGSFVWLAVVSTLARMFVYSISIASLARPVVPAKAGTPGGEEHPHSSAGAPASAGTTVWIMMIAAIAVCIWAASQSSFESWRMLLILVAAGTALYAAARVSARRAAVSSIQPPPSTRDPS